MENSTFLIIFLISVFISSISQVMLKCSANKKELVGFKQYINPLVIVAYLLFFSSTLLTTMAYRGVPMSLGPVIEATGYVYVIILGRLFLHEKITKRKLVGNVLIIIGIIVYAI